MYSRLPALALLFNALVWGLSWWPLRTMQAAGLHAVWATALMYAALLAGLTLASPRSWAVLARQPGLWLLALCSGLNNVAFNWAMSTGDVVRVILLFYLMPAWAVLLAWRILGERPTPQGLLRLALAFAGMALVVVPPEGLGAAAAQLSLADGLALLGGFSFALTNVILRRLQATPARARMLAMFCGCMGLGGATAVLGGAAGVVPGLPAPQPLWLACAAGLALLIAVGNWALQYGASRLPTATTALIMLSEVVFAAVSSWLLGQAEITGRTLLGGALIVLAALLAVWPQGRRGARAATA